MGAFFDEPRENGIRQCSAQLRCPTLRSDTEAGRGEVLSGGSMAGVTLGQQGDPAFIAQFIPVDEFVGFARFGIEADHCRVRDAEATSADFGEVFTRGSGDSTVEFTLVHGVGSGEGENAAPILGRLG